MLLCLVLVLAACSSAPVMTHFDRVVVDDAFTTQEQTEVRASLSEWSEKTTANEAPGVTFGHVETTPHDEARRLAEEPDTLYILRGVQGECPDAPRKLGVWDGHGIPAGVTYPILFGVVECLDADWIEATIASGQPDYFGHLVLHETGHAIGLQFPGPDPVHYTGAGASVMHPSLDETQHLTCIDISAFGETTGSFRLEC